MKNHFFNNCLLSLSGGQDSMNLTVFYLVFFRLNYKKIFLLWFNNLWKINDFYVFRHVFNMSFLFHNRFYYTIIFSKQFSETNAREFRYFFFMRVAFYSKSTYILTAHTQTDSVETFFINLFRGSGKFGLQIIRNSQTLLNNKYLQYFF